MSNPLPPHHHSNIPCEASRGVTASFILHKVFERPLGASLCILFPDINFLILKAQYTINFLSGLGSRASAATKPQILTGLGFFECFGTQKY